MVSLKKKCPDCGAENSSVLSYCEHCSGDLYPDGLSKKDKLDYLVSLYFGNTK